ncbi:MAG: Tryptophan synthase alpha chain [Labilithrix sp.]|nr:Tryptophan synthase alpha chain [Labilithrix sp.]
MIPFRVRSAAVIVGSALFLALLGSSPAGCASDTRLGVIDNDAGTPPAPFAPPDAGGDVSTAPLLCATAECPAGTTTCATSRARCDVDLTSNRNNCGACGAACPPDQHRSPWDEGPNLEVMFACVDRKCTMRCQSGFGDCDGIPDNGCEVDLATAENCGACGAACAPGVPCVQGQCGCAVPEVLCNGSCADLQRSYEHCGACDSPCNDPAPPPPEHNLQMECVNAECKRTCRPPFADCNGDPSDGCEKDLSIPDDQNCGECGAVCPSGTACDAFDDNFRLRCGCPPGLQACPTGSLNTCEDVLTDPLNCGGCGVICTSEDSAFARPVCRGGLCDIVCKTGHGDCNGFAGDGCEVDLETDPRNCGACGHACNAELGQPCVKGKCVETECGGGSR